MGSGVTRCPRGPPSLDDRVRFFAAGGNTRQRHVRNLQQNALQLFLDPTQFGLETSDLIADPTPSGDQVVGRLPGPLSPGDVLRVRIAKRLAFVSRLNQRPPLDVERLAAIDQRGNGLEITTSTHALAEHIDLLTQHPHVVHVVVPRLVLWESVSERVKPAVPIEVSVTLRIRFTRSILVTMSFEKYDWPLIANWQFVRSWLSTATTWPGTTTSAVSNR